MFRRFSVLVLIVILVVTLASCGNKMGQPFESQDFFMGTVVSQKIYGRDVQQASAAVFERMAEIESSMTINEAGGEINRLNGMAGKGLAQLKPDTFYVLKKAYGFARLSGGAFDVTIGPLVKAWGIFTKHPRVPSESEISGLVKLVGYKDLEIDEKRSSAGLAKPGQLVDLGGIAKGYAGDEAIRIYKKYGITSAYVNLGGNVVVLGGKPDGSPWKIGVQNPRAPNGKYIGIVDVRNKAVVSSGDYERYYETNGVRYHHIIDPRTGYPADSGLISTTIVADLSIDADALSTATFVLGLEKGMELVESLDGVEAVFVTKDKKVYTTEGLKGKFQFDDESREFEYVEKG